MAEVTKWDKSLTVPVVNALTGEQSTVWIARRNEHDPVVREFRNAPIQWLYPEFVNGGGLVILDWKPVMVEIRHKLDLEHAKLRKMHRPTGDMDKQFRQQMGEALRAGVDFNGQHYMPWGWGSGAKNHQTLGLTEDIGKRDGIVQYIEAYQRLGRAWTPNGLYGGGVCKILVKFGKAGEFYSGHPIADGCSLITKKLWESIKEDAAPIALGEGGQNYQIWQQYEYDDGFVEDLSHGFEVMKKRGEELPMTLAAMWGEIGDFKRRLLETDDFMIHHPYLSAHLRSSTGEILFNMGTTVFVPGKMRIVLPGKTWVIDSDNETAIVCRWPIDAKSNVQAIQNSHGDVVVAEQARMATIEAIQSSWTNMTFHKKGMDAVVDDLGGVDAVVCVDDVKMVAGFDIGAWRERNAGKIVEMEVFISATQYYGPNSIMFAPVERWKALGGDYDGDMAFVMESDEYPHIWSQAYAWRNETSSIKIFKTRTYDPWDKWIDFLIDSFIAGVGMASNVMAQTYVEQPSNRQVVVDLLNEKVADIFNFARSEKAFKDRRPTPRMLDWVLNRSVKFFTDRFKTMYGDIDLEMLRLRRIQTAISSRYGGTPAWVGWRRNRLAFRAKLPMLRSELPPEMLAAAEETGSRFRQTDDWTIHIADAAKNGTIPQIYLWMRPYIQEQFEKLMKGGTLDFIEAMNPAPLSDFENWAPQVDEVMLTIAHGLVTRFLDWSDSINHELTSEVDVMESNIAAIASKMVKEEFGGNRTLASYATWRASHHSRSNLAGAGCVFAAFPEESIKIVKDKPGLHQSDASYHSVVTGAQYNFTKLSNSVGPFIGRVTHVVFKKETRLAVFSDEPLPDQTGGEAGSDLVGFIPGLSFKQSVEGITAPPVGKYLIKMDRVKGKDGEYTVTYHGHFTTF